MDPLSHSAVAKLAGTDLSDDIDLACDRFETDWRHGRQPQIRDFLDGAAASDRPRLLRELVLLDSDLRRQAGVEVDVQDYRRTFGDAIDDFAEDLSRANAATLVSVTETAAGGKRQAGQSVGRFALVRQLGGGGGGEVWLARDDSLQRDVAIKFPHAANVTSEEMTRFLREGQAMAQLRHPHIVTVYETSPAGGEAYLVTEFFPQGDLRKLLARRQLSPPEAAAMAADLADALQFAHERGVAHRDLKPANVLLSEDLQPHLTDFGLAKWSRDARQLTVTGQMFGTVAYMSPEQAAGKKVDHRTDLYSLGVVLYEMTAGRCPFVGGTASVLRAVATDDPPPPRRFNSSLPKDLETICLKAMQKEAADRYATAQEMAADLRRFQRGEPIQARRLPWLRSAWRTARRRPAAVASAALAVAALLSTGAALALRAKNAALSGVRTVIQETSPPGARVVFVKLDPETNEPLAQSLTDGGRSPVQAELAPGDYLVVAALDDGRFHEVCRRVPDPEGILEEGRQGLRFVSGSPWKIDAQGNVELRLIAIPPADVANGLVRIEASEEAALATEQMRGAARFQSFYVQPREFTVGDCRQVLPGAAPQDAHRALRCSYQEASALAEAYGMRLPTLAEFEFLITAGMTQRYPWGNASLPEIDPQGERFQATPTGEPAFDRLTIAPQVAGLFSNVPEWTSTGLRSAQLVASNPLHNPRSSFRMVVGPIFEQDESSTSSQNSETAYSRAVDVFVGDQVGFRGCRSLRPRLTADEF